MYIHSFVVHILLGFLHPIIRLVVIDRFVYTVCTLHTCLTLKQKHDVKVLVLSAFFSFVFNNGELQILCFIPTFSLPLSVAFFCLFACLCN